METNKTTMPAWMWKGFINETEAEDKTEDTMCRDPSHNVYFTRKKSRLEKQLFPSSAFKKGQRLSTMEQG